MNKQGTVDMTIPARICKTCRYHYEIDDGCVCVNDQSYYRADWTEDNHSCEKWEGRDENTK